MTRENARGNTNFFQGKGLVFIGIYGTISVKKSSEAQQNEMERTYRLISFETAKRMMDENPEHLILDVRGEEEYVTGHASGAVLLPLDAISAETAAEAIPSKTTLVFAYCRSGRRSRLAVDKLIELGYTNVYDIGSLVGWPYGMEW